MSLGSCFMSLFIYVSIALFSYVLFSYLFRGFVRSFVICYICISVFSYVVISCFRVSLFRDFFIFIVR